MLDRLASLAGRFFGGRERGFVGMCRTTAGQSELGGYLGGPCEVDFYGHQGRLVGHVMQVGGGCIVVWVFGVIVGRYDMASG